MPDILDRKFSLMDFVKRQGLRNITGIYGEECLNDDGTVMSLADQAAVITHYLKLRNNVQFVHPYEKRGARLLGLWQDFICGKGERECDDKNAVAEAAQQYITYLFNDVYNSPFPPQQHPRFTFIDLFAGIGGFRMAFQNLGGECVFSSEWDEQAQRTYYANYGEVPFGDITKESTKQMIPDNFDILCAGFPCQAFSLAGKRRGFAETRGTLFFDVAEILRRKQPKAFFLENVKGLAIHDRGRTLETILNTLDEVGYVVPNPQILNAMNYGVPQHRERIYIVGFRRDLGITADDFTYPVPNENIPCWLDVREENPVPAKYYLSTTYIETLRRHRARHEAAGHGFGYKIIDDNGVANAIVCGGMGRECNLIIDNRQDDLTPTTHIKGEINHEGIRKMTPREWARLQGYPDNFKIVVADASAYKQFGNSVAVPAIQATARQILEPLEERNII
ncbi:MAG: DNA cytosine methyltransferase [Bacteroidales bacterium]|nr:DNA cytosine methyltransferase [Bacteroidales bacterium]